MAGTVQNRSKVAISSLALFCVALFLASYSSKHSAVTGLGGLLVHEALRPFQLILEGVSQKVTGLWDDYLALLDVRQENKRLKDRLQVLEVENSGLVEWQEEIKRLRGLVGIAQEQSFQGVAADVIGYDPSNWVQAVTVDKGSAEGVGLHMPAIMGNSVVGQVIAVSPHVARVLLIVDHSSGVDSIVQSSRVRGVVEGLGKELCELRYVLQEEEIEVGDRIVTSGMDGIFPKGLVLGIVSEVDKKGEGLFQAIKVKPSVTFSRLETLFIVTNAGGRSAEIELLAGEKKGR